MTDTETRRAIPVRRTDEQKRDWGKAEMAVLDVTAEVKPALAELKAKYDAGCQQIEEQRAAAVLPFDEQLASLKADYETEARALTLKVTQAEEHYNAVKARINAEIEETRKAKEAARIEGTVTSAGIAVAVTEEGHQPDLLDGSTAPQPYMPANLAKSDDADADEG